MKRLLIIPVLLNIILLDCSESSIGHHSKKFDELNKAKHYKNISIVKEPKDNLDSKENLVVADRVKEEIKQSSTKTGN